MLFIWVLFPGTPVTSKVLKILFVLYCIVPYGSCGVGNSHNIFTITLSLTAMAGWNQQMEALGLEFVHGGKSLNL